MRGRRKRGSRREALQMASRVGMLVKSWKGTGHMENAQQGQRFTQGARRKGSELAMTKSAMFTQTMGGWSSLLFLCDPVTGKLLEFSRHHS
jgi:hypothetical protein